MQIVPGVFIKDVGVGWEDFTQVEVMVKVKELPEVHRGKSIAQYSDDENYGETEL